jgi:putative hydrolase of the HAD superfamily
MGQTIIALDYDGVLVDSYNGLEKFYLEDFPAMTGHDTAFGRHLLYMEYLAEGCGLLRIDWWPSIMDVQDDLLLNLLLKYWERRIENSAILPGVFTALKMFRERNYRVIHVGFMDDIPGLKRWRLDADGLAPYFDEIIIVGEDFSSRSSWLEKSSKSSGAFHGTIPLETIQLLEIS